MIDGPPIRFTWYEIWGAAVMIVAMCGRFGKDGVSAVVGMNVSFVYSDGSLY